MNFLNIPHDQINNERLEFRLELEIHLFFIAKISKAKRIWKKSF